MGISKSRVTKHPQCLHTAHQRDNGGSGSDAHCRPRVLALGDAETGHHKCATDRGQEVIALQQLVA